jgi:hypothetical protein
VAVVEYQVDWRNVAESERTAAVILWEAANIVENELMPEPTTFTVSPQHPLLWQMVSNVLNLAVRHLIVSGTDVPDEGLPAGYRVVVILDEERRLTIEIGVLPELHINTYSDEQQAAWG